MTGSVNGTSSTTRRDEIPSKAARLVAIDTEMSKLALEREALVDWFESAGTPVVATEKPTKAVKLPAPTVLFEKTQHAGSFAARLVAHLQAQPERKFTIKEVHDEVDPSKSMRGVRSALFALMNARNPKVWRPSKALYQAAVAKVVTP